MDGNFTGRAWLWLIVLSIILFIIIAVALWWANPVWVQSTNSAGQKTGSVNGVAVILIALLAVIVLWIIGAIFAMIAALLAYGYASGIKVDTPTVRMYARGIVAGSS